MKHANKLIPVARNIAKAFSATTENEAAGIAALNFDDMIALRRHKLGDVDKEWLQKNAPAAHGYVQRDEIIEKKLPEVTPLDINDMVALRRHALGDVDKEWLQKNTPAAHKWVQRDEALAEKRNAEKHHTPYHVNDFFAVRGAILGLTPQESLTEAQTKLLESASKNKGGTPLTQVGSGKDQGALQSVNLEKGSASR